MARLPHWSSLAAIVIMLSGIGVATVIELTKTVELNEFGVVPDFSLVERSGRRVTLGDLTGKSGSRILSSPAVPAPAR